MTDQFHPSASATDYDKYEVNQSYSERTDAPPSQVFSIVDQSVVETGVHEFGSTTKPVQEAGPRTRFIRRAKKVVQAVDAPTWGLDLREISDGIEHARSRTVIDLAMRLAESTLSTGASAADVTANILAVAKAYGLKAVHVDVTFTSITVTHHRGAYEDPVTMMRTVRVRAADYERLEQTHALIDDIVQGGLPLEEARSRFTTIMEQPHLYRRGVITVSLSLLAAGVALLIGGRAEEIIVTMAVVALVDRAFLWSARHRLAAFFGQMLGGAIPTTVAMAIVAGQDVLPAFVAELRPSIIVTTGIVVLLAGLSVVGSAQDAIDGYYVTAAARTFEVVVLTLGILVGVLGVILVASRLGVPAYIVPPATFAGAFGVQVVAVIVIAAAAALGAYAGVRTIVVSGGMAVISWTAYSAAIGLGFDVMVSTALACVVAGFAAQPLAGWFRVPSLALSTAGLIAFLPGGMVYRGLYYLVEPAPVETSATHGPTLLITAAATGLAIAGGISLGSYFGRGFRRDLHGGRAGASERALRRAHTDSRE